MKQIATIGALVLVLSLALAANAEDGRQRPVPPAFSDIDTNDDQLLSREEIETAMQNRVHEEMGRHGPKGGREGRFERADSDGDGYLSEAEFDVVREKMDQRRGRHHRRGDCGQQDDSAA